MDAITLLKQDHREVEGMFDRFTTASAQERRSIAESVIAELSKHDAVEVVHLYPAVRQAGQTGEGLTEHGLEEHKEAQIGRAHV